MCKYTRHFFSVLWAYEYLHRALATGNTRRAWRARELIYQLENWPQQNAPVHP